MTAEPPDGNEKANELYLTDLRRTRTLPTRKQVLPTTSSQEIGWFTQVQPVDPFQRDTRVTHPRRYSTLTRYMDVYWGYYPPGPAKFHPKDK